MALVLKVSNYTSNGEGKKPSNDSLYGHVALAVNSGEECQAAKVFAALSLSVGRD